MPEKLATVPPGTEKLKLPLAPVTTSDCTTPPAARSIATLASATPLPSTAVPEMITGAEPDTTYWLPVPTVPPAL